MVRTYRKEMTVEETKRFFGDFIDGYSSELLMHISETDETTAMDRGEVRKTVFCFIDDKRVVANKILLEKGFEKI